MTRPLEVLIIESHRGVAASAADGLEAAGHHVHRCHDDDSHGFPCRGVIDPAGCPLVSHMDVALLARRRVAPRPTALEQGATCAIRADVPVVEDGPAALDPYEPWLAARVDGDVVAACEAAADAALDDLRHEILHMATPILVGAGIPTHQAHCHVDTETARLGVRFDLPVAVTPTVKQALAVRALDAVRETGRAYGPIEISVHAPA
jgi:hypothetical protein